MVSGILLIAATLASCTQAVAAAAVAFVTEKYIPFQYEGATYQTYTKVVGKLSSSSTPLVVLHGGPGLSHDYLLPIAKLADSGTPVIFYDQIGNARSTHLDSKPESFWDMDLFVAELTNLVQYYKVEKSFSLLGHSWGGVLAPEYVVRKEPAGLKHLVLSDTLASAALWSQSLGELIQQYPESVQEGIVNGYANATAYKAALQAVYADHGCRISPWPKQVTYSFDWAFWDTTVPSAPGILTADWSIIDRLDQIHVPTLVINGQYDLAQDFVVQPFVDGIANAQHVKFENSSHMPFWEEQGHYIDVLKAFL